jgi:hypothetical protein
MGLEVPTGDQGGQAADVLLLAPPLGIHVEVETLLVDVQAQLRRGMVKREALERKLNMKLAFVLAVGDSQRNRDVVRSAESIIRAALPAPSRSVLAAIRSGLPLSTDGLVFVRRAPRTR